MNSDVTRWIVGILVVISLILNFYTSYQLYDAMRDFSEGIEEITAPYKVYEEQEEQIEELLADKGYEVLSVYMFNYTTEAPFYELYGIERNFTCKSNYSAREYCYTNDVAVSIEMKSLGSKSEQVWDALISSGVVYPDAFVHWITIKYPTETCKWTIFGVWKWVSTEDYEELQEIHNLIQYQIDELSECS